MSLSVNCTLLCASGAAYDIKNSDGKYYPDIIFSKAVQYIGDPIAISTGDNNINACLVGQTAMGIIVAFRGTLPTTLVDWFQDLLIEPVPSPGLPGKVHYGFQAAVQAMYPKILVAVKSFNPSVSNPVYVTGHSKGGGMAPLAAYLLRRDRVPLQQVITFAAPKSGNDAFATAYNSAIRNHIRYENYGDIVPLLPPPDEFVSLLAYVVSWIPDIGQELAELLRKAAGWDYTAVGSKLYIEPDHSICTHEPDDEQIAGVGYYLWENGDNVEAAVGNAHTLGCSYGYMSGTCPSTVCTAT